MIRCPKCGERFGLQEGQAEGEWAEIISLLPIFGNHGKIVFEYVELFGVVPLRGRGKKILRLLKEVAKLFGSEKFDFQKREYRISKVGIMEALQVVCNKQFSSKLENHNYLKKVMMGIAEHEQKERRDRADKDLRRLEDKKMRRLEDKDEQAEGEVITAGEYKKRKKIDSLVDQIGKQFGARRIE
uniref:Uncharacterized protein n=1 Tax=viral metagenome TaxID=1070528 RepID=A0A6M3ISK8_9ZZZZ